MLDFGFDIDATGWISFRIMFEQGILPQEFPQPRQPRRRRQKGDQPGAENWAEPATADNAPENPGEPSDDPAAYLPAPVEDYTIATTEGTVIAQIHHEDLTAPAEEPETPRFDAPGKKRGELARAIARLTDSEAEYLNPPSYAYQIGELTLTRDGTIEGELPFGLLTALHEEGFERAE